MRPVARTAQVEYTLYLRRPLLILHLTSHFSYPGPWRLACIRVLLPIGY